MLRQDGDGDPEDLNKRTKEKDLLPYDDLGVLFASSTPLIYSVIYFRVPAAAQKSSFSIYSFKNIFCSEEIRNDHRPCPEEKL